MEQTPIVKKTVARPTMLCEKKKHTSPENERANLQAASCKQRTRAKAAFDFN
jgi:hypothetical protein